MQTALAVEVQALDRNWPVVHVVQGLQTDNPVDALKLPAEHPVHTADASIPTPVLNVPAEHPAHATDAVIPTPVLNVPAEQAAQVGVPLVVQLPKLPAAQGGHARMIMGTYVSSRQLYRAATSVLVSALW